MKKHQIFSVFSMPELKNNDLSQKLAERLMGWEFTSHCSDKDCQNSIKSLSLQNIDSLPNVSVAVYHNDVEGLQMKLKAFHDSDASGVLATRIRSFGQGGANQPKITTLWVATSKKSTTETPSTSAHSSRSTSCSSFDSGDTKALMDAKAAMLRACQESMGDGACTTAQEALQALAPIFVGDSMS